MTLTQLTSVQANMNAYWTERAPLYDANQQRPERFERDVAAWSQIWGQALPASPADVLDLGTGSGFVAFVHAGNGHRVTATDLSDGMIEIARARAAQTPNAPDFGIGDAVSPDFTPGSFDAITNRYVMWTLREPEVALANWRRLLRPGGTLAVVDSTWFPEGLDLNPTPGFADWYDEHVRSALPLAEASTIEPTVEVVRAAGFRDVTVTPLTSILELDREYGVAPGHDVQLQYLVRGTA
ncbi:class I SAM-dependent methyltransferase [Nocardioides alcanivorans]|uniref:class I SAM-dependent methyltransferase n=1 Tax=Nocardioides alcanivorans TaxID=2897352 RepID=UPI001F22C50C|nr:class I SAM-dependent methyltransferase [Nocardioides alcanivorans]